MRLPAPGELFERKYKIIQALGAGGFATVFRAQDIEIGRDVAIKVLSPEEDGRYRKGVAVRFMREARVLAGLQDPHTIRLFEFGEAADGLLYMVFQFVAGMDLSTLLNRRGALPVPTAVHIATQVLEALAEAHAAGVLHRDIKPANVLVHHYMGDEFAVKLLDFGIAKMDADDGASLTKTGTILGTPRYMAPEQIYGERLTPAADLYSLGLVVMEMLTGVPAIDGTQKEMLKLQTSPQPLLLPPNVGWPALREAIERMVAREPAARFQSARQAADALRTAMQLPQHTAVGDFARPVTRGIRVSTETVKPAEMPPRKRPIAPIVLALGVFGVAVAAYWSHQRGQERVLVAPRTSPTALLRGASEQSAQPASGSAVAVGRAEAPDAGATDASTADAKPKYRAPTGCGKALPPASNPKGKRWFASQVQGASRPVRYWVPESYDPKRKYPVVLLLTFINHDAGDYFNRSQMAKLVAEGEQFIAVAPEPENRYDPWTDPRDIDLARGSVGLVADHLCVDTTRIFGMGHDQGAVLLRRLACELPFSAMATTGDGEKHGAEACEGLRGIPMLRIIGEEDYFVPIRGGTGCRGGDYLSHEAHEEVWRRRNGCTGDGEVWSADDKCKLWECSDGAFASCVVPGGHYLRSSGWSYTDPAGCGAPPMEHPLGETTWRFFSDFGEALPKENAWLSVDG